MVVAVRVVVAMSVVVAFRGLGAARRVGVSVSVVMIVVVPMIAVIMIMIVARLAGMVVVLAHASFPLEGSAICSSISFRTSLMCASAAE